METHTQRTDLWTREEEGEGGTNGERSMKLMHYHMQNRYPEGIFCMTQGNQTWSL